MNRTTDSKVERTPDVSSNGGGGATNPWQRLRWFLSILGPGLITGASDDDPSGIGTYSVAGAKFGYASLWTALVTFPLMAAVQLICARIALATGKGIGTVLRQRF